MPALDFIDSEKDLFDSSEESNIPDKLCDSHTNTNSCDVDDYDPVTEAYFFMPGLKGDYNELNNSTPDNVLSHEELIKENAQLKTELEDCRAMILNLQKSKILKKLHT